MVSVPVLGVHEDRGLAGRVHERAGTQHLRISTSKSLPPGSSVSAELKWKQQASQVDSLPNIPSPPQNGAGLREFCRILKWAEAGLTKLHPPTCPFPLPVVTTTLGTFLHDQSKWHGQ